MTVEIMTEEKIQSYPLHMQGDYRQRNENIKAGHTLCEECGGTGNELLSMFRACPVCDKGAVKEKKDDRGTEDISCNLESCC